MKRLIITILSAILCSTALLAQSSQERVDSLVSLLSAKSMRLIDSSGVSYRKVVGPARFLHNNTYLDCDTAWWNVDSKVIDAVGNVRIIQEETVLTGDSLRYLVDFDLAQFRGHLVQLEDKDHNLLRTRTLDYNTKDSVAVFRDGGSLKDKEGQIIESINGRYSSKEKLFLFTDNVNMFTDSIFIKTTRIEYFSDLNYATFGTSTDVWKEGYMLSSNAGWYDRNIELFLFNKDVHCLSEDREGWSDSLYYHRNTSNVELYGNVQITDTVKNVTGLSGALHYVDSLSMVTMFRDPAAVGISDSTGTYRDSVWFAADSLVYRTAEKFKVSNSTITYSEKRLTDLEQDAVKAYRERVAEEARQAVEAEKKRLNPKAAMEEEAKSSVEDQSDEPAPELTDSLAVSDSLILPDSLSVADSLSIAEPIAAADSLVTTNDSLAIAADSPEVADQLAGVDSLSTAVDSLPTAADSLSTTVDSLTTAVDSLAAGLLAGADSLAVSDTLQALDSTKISLITAINNVRLYKYDVQLRCDSLEYNTIDSLVRLYKEPYVWSDNYRQYSADSLYIVFKNKKMEKADLLSRAFVIIQEDTLCFDQVRGAEMLAYFDEDNNLSRFDALGEANGLFYIKEDSTLATINTSKAKMIHALFQNGEVDQVFYFESAKSDAYPIAQIEDDARLLKGFNWKPEIRPNSPDSITTRTIRPTQRRLYESRPRAEYKQTDLYFPGYMQGVFLQIKANEKARQERKLMEARMKQQTDSLALADSLFATDSLLAVENLADSLAISDSLSADINHISSDSLVVADSLTTASDTLKVAKEPVISAKELKLKEKEKEKEKSKAERIAAKEARWAALDEKDAQKVKEKAEKKAAKLRNKKRKALDAQKEQALNDAKVLDQYIKRYRKRKAAMDAKKKAEKVEEEPPVIDSISS